MTITPVDVIRSHLKPLCSRDNHVMKLEFSCSGLARANTGNQSSYHCGYVGCSVLYKSTHGYYTLMGIPGRTYTPSAGPA